MKSSWKELGERTGRLVLTRLTGGRLGQRKVPRKVWTDDEVAEDAIPGTLNEAIREIDKAPPPPEVPSIGNGGFDETDVYELFRDAKLSDEVSGDVAFRYLGPLSGYSKDGAPSSQIDRLLGVSEDQGNPAVYGNQEARNITNELLGQSDHGIAIHAERDRRLAAVGITGEFEGQTEIDSRSDRYPIRRDIFKSTQYRLNQLDPETVDWAKSDDYWTERGRGILETNDQSRIPQPEIPEESRDKRDLDTNFSAVLVLENPHWEGYGTEAPYSPVK